MIYFISAWILGMIMYLYSIYSLKKNCGKRRGYNCKYEIFRLPLITWIFFGLLALIPFVGIISSFFFKVWFQFHKENSTSSYYYQYDNSRSILSKIGNFFRNLERQY